MDLDDSFLTSPKEKRQSSSSAEDDINEDDADAIEADERNKYASQIRESQGRLDKYTAENDRLLDEVSNLRLQIREMKNDRTELVRAHHESMSLLAQVSEEKLTEYKSKSEQEALESKFAQEEALRTVLEMMERDCEERVAELDKELARVEADRERAIQLQLEAASKAAQESTRKAEVEDAARLAIEKLVQERQTRNQEIGYLEEREQKLKQELEMTKKLAEMDKIAAIQAAQAIADLDESEDSFKSPLVEPTRPPVVSHRGIQTYQESPFLHDPLHEMTYGRRIALRLQTFSCYQPKGRHWDFNGLGLQSAWAHFEHSVLPRYISGSKPASSRRSGSNRRVGSNADLDDDVDDWLYRPEQRKRAKSNDPSVKKGDLQRAEPGESELPTKLYSPLFTPLSQMGDFGLGVGLYFSSLRAIALITLIAGLINLPNILFFASDTYSAGQPGVSFLLKGSALCTEQAWVPCPTCSIDTYDKTRDRIAGTTTVTPDGELQTLVFAKKNACDGATMHVGIVNLASLFFIMLAIIVLSVYQKRKLIEFDEQEQTAQDYSIEILNPPRDATEPEEWKKFFESRFSVQTTCCTVSINNDLLIKALVERREVLHRIEEKIKEGATGNILSLSEYAAKVEHRRGLIGYLQSRISPGIPELVGRLTVLNQKIQGLAQQNYCATRVFCTFEQESMQREILSKMKVGPMNAHLNRVHTVDPNLLFRDEFVLDVREADEPSTIRWMDLDKSWITKIKQQSVTSLISVFVIVAVAVIVALCRSQGAAYAAFAISVSNALFPAVAKMLTNAEAHASETGKQRSLFAKIAIFRWVVTAIVITIITPFTSTITKGPDHLLESIWLIFFADLVTSNALQISDPVSNFKRHFLAPRAKSQERMNLLMSGTEYTIAERYTNMTKTLFLTFYYCAIYPSLFFICAVTLFINFFVDKFSLMRTWKPAPMLGASIAKFSRIYFTTTSVAALALVSSYMFAGFPYDNLCADNASHSAYYGNWQVTDGLGQTSTATIEPNQRSYHFCNQYIGPGGNFAFPVSPDSQPSGSQWMTRPQEQLVGIYGVVSVAILGLVGAVFAYRVYRLVQKLFSSSYKSNGSDQGKHFSEVETISSYIPQIKSEQFTYPLLAVNVDYVGQSIFDWSDPARSHSYYDLTRDVDQMLKGIESEEICYRAFGQIRHWPPDGEEEGNHGPKSSLRRSKEAAYKRNVSWSSKVTCKTYSKDTPMTQESFNANASTNQGMNFDGHAEPIFDPHTQNEAKGFGMRNESEAPPQTPPPKQFDQYYNAGVDDANQQSDPFFDDSQNQYSYGSESSIFQPGGSSSTSSTVADNTTDEGSDSGHNEEDDEVSFSGDDDSSYSEQSQTSGGSEDPSQTLLS